MTIHHPITTLHDQKANSYFELIREDVAALVPTGMRRILDIGCSKGKLGQYLKEHRGAEYVAGVELIAEHAAVAAQRLDKVFVGNMETDTLDIPTEFFDCIICADVLEHMIDPWTFVQRLNGYLVPNGIIVSSIPNVAHITVILELLRGRWEYQPSGLLDKGHLRFFTKRSITAMFHDAGFTIERWDINASQTLKFKIAELLTFGLFRPLSINQYLFVARHPEGKSTNAGTIGNHR